jgi:beta-N-acetylhexosaminidase
MDPHIEQILDSMTLAEKVGQLLLVYFTGPDLSPQLQEMIDSYHIGGVILYQISGNLISVSQVSTLTQQIQSMAKIPLWIAIDQEGGAVDRLPPEATHFPSAMAVAATGDLDWAKQMAAITAVELRALGINLNFAPVVDVNSNPANPIIGIRAYGSDPQQVSQWGEVVFKTYERAGILTTLKHFPGHGDTVVDSHLGLPRVERSLPTLEAVDLFPFQQLIQRGAAAIMTAHVLVPALYPDHPATLSSRILQDVLRQKWGFQGLIVTDSLTMGALDQTWNSAEAALLALEAGADVLLFGADAGHSASEPQLAYDLLLKAVQEGRISRERLDASVSRILHQKTRLGLWQPPPFPPLNQIGEKSHQAVAEQIAKASVTLVKDDYQKLPLATSEKILVIWPQACGDLGSACRAVFSTVTCHPLSLHPDQETLKQIQALAAQFSLILLGTYELYRYPAQLKLVQSLPHDKLVVIAMGSPYDLMLSPDIPCYLATYGDSPISLQAAVQNLVGTSLPQGRLPVDLGEDFPADPAIGTGNHRQSVL